MVTSKPVHKKKIKYPYIGHNEETKRVVLFVDPSKGMLLAEPATSAEVYGIGYYSGTWSENKFRPFEGTITLEND